MSVTDPGSHFDTVLEGRRSYQVGLDAGVPDAYPHLRHVVFSRTLAESPDPRVELVGTDPVAYVQALKRQPGTGIWLVGGAELAATLRPEIDQLIIKRAPIAIGAGIPLFAGPFAVDRYRPVHSDALDSGIVVTTYRRATPTVLPTERLELRPMSRAQAERILAGDRGGQRWSPGYPRDDDRDVARMALRQDPTADPWFGPLQIVERDTGLVVGGLGCFGPPGDRTVEFGYGVAPEAAGRGFATEAVRALLDHAFGTGLVDRAIADTSHDNVASQRVLEKAGLRRYASDDRLHYYELHRPG